MSTPRTVGTSKTERMIPISRWWLFPIGMLIVYGFLALLSSNDASQALSGSGHVFRILVWPLSLVFGSMVALNLFVKPSHVVRFLGRESGGKGIALSVAAGIMSTGPIYAWYPLLKDLRGKGAADSLIAIFLYNRAVKPFLLPVMIGYFGWKYVVILTVFTVLGSIFVGYGLRALMKGKNQTSSEA